MTGEAPETTIGPSGHPGPAWLHKVPAGSVGSQTGQFGRSEAEAKLHRLGLDPDPSTLGGRHLWIGMGLQIVDANAIQLWGTAGDSSGSSNNYSINLYRYS